MLGIKGKMNLLSKIVRIMHCIHTRAIIQVSLPGRFSFITLLSVVISTCSCKFKVLRGIVVALLSNYVRHIHGFHNQLIILLTNKAQVTCWFHYCNMWCELRPQCEELAFSHRM